MIPHKDASIFLLVLVISLRPSHTHPWDPDLSQILHRNQPSIYSVTPPTEIRLGDMILSSSDFVNETNLLKNAVSDPNRRWDNNTIPYVVDKPLLSHLTLIKEAMDQFHTYTCLRFIPRREEKDYIHIVSKEGCYSHVGNARKGSQDVSLGRGCHFMGTVVHELGHAVGFYHEHDRGDRDDFIQIHWNNIERGLEDQFEKVNPSMVQYLTGYDVDSIMHYGETAFSKDGKSRTMTKRKAGGAGLKNPYDKQGMDDGDVRRVNLLYGC